MKKKICIVFGTRPEAIKLAPVVRQLQDSPALEVSVCVTGQHREMLDQVLDIFEIRPDVDLNLMRPNQTLAELTARAIVSLDGAFADVKPDCVMVQGDTTTAFTAALASFYHQVPVAHVEAGLRTHNLQAPWPEEANRVMVSRITDIHFAPTAGSRQNLLDEGIPERQIHVTGNTVIDALFLVLEKVRASAPPVPGLSEGFFSRLDAEGKRLVLVTGHRRENFGRGFENICTALKRISKRDDVEIVYPVHLNPNVKSLVLGILGNEKNITLIDPVSYLPFVRLMDKAHIIITDSGGIQEEAPSLGKPVLVMRDTTERPEAVDAGTVKLVGTDVEKIASGAHRLLDDRDAFDTMAIAHNPYGDGYAAQRIQAVLENAIRSQGAS